MSIYIHQNPNNANINLSLLAHQLKKDTIMQHQMGLVNAQKMALQEMVMKTPEGEETLKTTLQALQTAAAQTATQLQSVSFKGVLTKGGQSKISAQALQNKLSKEAESLHQYAKIIKEYLQVYGGKSSFTDAEINTMKRIKENVTKAIAMLKSNAPVNNYKETLGYITGVASDAIGSLSEYHQAELLKQLGIKTTLTGASQGQSYKTKTSDYQITFQGVDEGQFIGVSVKRARTNTKSAYAKVKTTTLESLLTASQIDIDRYSLYNVIANHGREYFEFTESNGQGHAIPRGVWQYNDFNELVKNLHRAFLLTSLAGDLVASDFATYMVINDKVYSILDMVTGFFQNENTSGVSITSNLASSQKNIAQQHFNLVKNSIESNDYGAAGMSRSATMVRAISSMNLIIHARIALSLAI